MKYYNGGKSITLILLLFTGVFSSTSSFSQIDSSRMKFVDTLLIKINEGTNIRYGKFGEDSLKVVLQVKKPREIFPEVYIVNAKLIGDSSQLLLNVPAELKDSENSWAFMEYVATASNENIFIQPKEYAAYDYSPFEYKFESNPPMADIYLVPLEKWNKLFNREDINFPFDTASLSKVARFKILSPTACSRSVFEEPYIGVFVYNWKIKLEYINPRRNRPADNKAYINFE